MSSRMAAVAKSQPVAEFVTQSRMVRPWLHMVGVETFLRTAVATAFCWRPAAINATVRVASEHPISESAVLGSAIGKRTKARLAPAPPWIRAASEHWRADILRDRSCARLSPLFFARPTPPERTRDIGLLFLREWPARGWLTPSCRRDLCAHVGTLGRVAYRAIDPLRSAGARTESLATVRVSVLATALLAGSQPRHFHPDLT